MPNSIWSEISGIVIKCKSSNQTLVQCQSFPFYSIQTKLFLRFPATAIPILSQELLPRWFFRVYKRFWDNEKITKAIYTWRRCTAWHWKVAHENKQRSNNDVKMSLATTKKRRKYTHKLAEESVFQVLRSEHLIAHSSFGIRAMAKATFTCNNNRPHI